MLYRDAARHVRRLEFAVVALAIGALMYRALIYGLLSKPPGASFGHGDIIDFALGLLLFLLGGACAGAGIVISALADCPDRGVAYRPVVIGMTSFVAYYLLHPYVPQLT